MNRTCCLVSAIVLALFVFAQSNATRRKLTDIAVNGPFQLSFDGDDNLYVVEHYGQRILRIDRSMSSMSIVAGNGKECCFKDGASARNISIYSTESMAVDKKGDIYFGGINARDGAFIREVDGVSGKVRTIAGGPSARSKITAQGVQPLEADVRDPKGMVFMKSGNLVFSVDGSYLLADLTDGKVIRMAGRGQEGFSGDGGLAVNATFDLPSFLARDKEGDLFVADYFNHRIRRIEAKSGIITTVAGNGAQHSTGDDGLAIEAGVEFPFGIAVDSQENLYLIENGLGTIRCVDSKTGLIRTIAGTGEWGFSGDGGQATKAEITPAAIALDSSGNLYFSDIEHNRIRKVDMQTGIISTVVGNGLPKRKIIIE